MEDPKKAALQGFFDQFKYAMILLEAAADSFVIACVEGTPSDYLSRC